MKAGAKFAAKWLSLAAVLLLGVGLVAPYLSGNRFAPRIQAALESALGRKVELGAVHFSLFRGPGFSVDKVVIHESPAIGVEPLAYVGSLAAVPRISSLFSGHLEFASIRLDDASINLAKTGSPSDPGHWNFEPLLNRSVIRAIPELHVRSGRINFKFGDSKSVFYLMETDLDIAPPARGGSDWSLEFSGQPARTDRPARGFGSFVAQGRWMAAGVGRLDLNLRLERSAVGEMIALLRGDNAGINGFLSARLHMVGPLDNIRISGSMHAEEVHRWDQMPPHGPGWPFNLAGRLNLPAQTLELESNSTGGEALPLSVRFRAVNYLSQPHWGVVLNWNRFPVDPLLDLARHMGAQLPPKLQIAGTLDGVLGYAGQGSLQGELDFHDASIAIPDSPPVRSDQARLIFDRGHARLNPAVIRTAQDEQAQVEADYDWVAQALDLTISTDAMRVESLHAQAALAAVPWLAQVPGGTWKGRLEYHNSAAQRTAAHDIAHASDAVAAGPAGAAAAQPAPPLQGNGWTGDGQLQDAQFALPGLAEPVAVASLAAHIDGPSVTLQQIRARAGPIAFQGEYRYEPQLARPHHLRIAIPEADAADLERVLMPSLHHSRGLLARALNLGRTSVPEWLAERHLDASIEIGSLRLAGAEAQNIQAHLLWDGAKAEFTAVQARVEGGRVTGTLSVNLRGSRPAYQAEARCLGIQWKSGKVDADSVLETSGIGAELLARLHATGTFTARGLEMDALPDLESIAGAYDLAWTGAAPLLRFPELQLVSGNDTYTGQGATQPDGRLLIQLSSGSKEMHMSGTLAELRLDEPEAR